MIIFITNGYFVYPYGSETTGYEVDDLASTLTKAQSLGVVVLVPPALYDGRKSAMVRFPGGYLAEIHQFISSH